MNRAYRVNHAATLLTSGQVLVAGGNSSVNLSSAEVFTAAAPGAPAMPNWALLSLCTAVFACGIGLQRFDGLLRSPGRVRMRCHVDVQ